MSSGLHFLNVTDVLFGILNNNVDPFLYALNFIIFHAKWYIAKQKYISEQISIFEFLHGLKRAIETEKFILFQNNKNAEFQTKWATIYDAL